MFMAHIALIIAFGQIEFFKKSCNIALIKKYTHQVVRVEILHSERRLLESVVEEHLQDQNSMSLH